MISHRGRTPRTVNYLKVLYFDRPDFVPAQVNILPAAWIKHRERIEEVILAQDLDRQMVPFASPGEIEDHVGEVYDALYLPEGGLMFVAEIGPDVPPQKVDAVGAALERVGGIPDPTELGE